MPSPATSAKSALRTVVLVRVQTKDTRATMVYEDGNGREHARQDIPYTDLPLAKVTLYACWDGEHWVIMLPSEY